ncbi:methanogenesis marker 2 protein [soil metagenome]
MTQSELAVLAAALVDGRGFAHKRDISDVLSSLSQALPGGTQALSQAVAIGDDCAAIPAGDSPEDGYLLFAIEGFLDDFVGALPWFAGYCGVMVNLSDICAMGGRPIAVVDALWSRGMSPGEDVMRGLAAASTRYGVPIVGGHSNNRSKQGSLAVAILGRAKRLLTSFDARPGDKLMMAIDLRGAFEEPHPFWNASTTAPAERLRADIELLPLLAEAGLCDAAKDISNAGAIGTALMLLECSKVGALIDVNDIPRPPGVPLLRWLQAFPSFGYVFSVRPEHEAAVAHHFDSQGIACATVGDVTAAPQVWLRDGASKALLWDVAEQPFIGARAAEVTCDA